MSTDTVEQGVEDARGQGRDRSCAAAERPDGEGWYYPPTVVADLTPEMRMYSEEVFAPVAGLFRVSDAESALEVANSTAFGLGSNVWTNSEREREQFVDGLGRRRRVRQRHD